jgi:small conductance mechanosensitive channel
MEQPIATVSKFLDTVIQFAVTYGFQVLGAVVFLAIGLKLSVWAGQKLAALMIARKVDASLARFLGTVAKVVMIGFVVIITLGNFGISIAPLIALAGASAFGATVALQGPLSNYGAGLSIILGRPFVVGNTITIKNVSGIVEQVTLANTVLVGEDGERIRVPNKEIVGQVIVNSRENRIVELTIPIGFGENVERAVAVLREILTGLPNVAAEPPPQVGIHDFVHGGVLLGVRFWVPARHYFQTRYAANDAFLKAMRANGIALLPPVTVAAAARPPVSASPASDPDA